MTMIINAGKIMSLSRNTAITIIAIPSSTNPAIHPIRDMLIIATIATIKDIIQVRFSINLILVSISKKEIPIIITH